MTDTADLNLVLAVIKPSDALQARAVRHLRRTGRLLVPFSVGVELLFVARRFGLGCVESLGAAEALDSGEVETVFDAVHLADAFHRSGSLHTADRRLLRTAFPTVRF